MLIWVIKDGENLPVQENTRPMRTGMLAAELASRGHRVVWWASSFSHQRKEYVRASDWAGEVAPNLTLRLLHAGQYQRNISISRYVHHYRLASRFGAAAKVETPPQLIVTAFPQIELSRRAVVYATARQVPVVVDVRDLWPDVYVDKSPKLLKPLVRLACRGDLLKTRRLLHSATAIVATSQGYLGWALRQGNRAGSWRDRVVYPGYPKSAGSSSETPNLNSLRCRLQGRTVFTFVGSFGHSYELDLICNVARQAEAQGLDKVHFVLAGDGEQFAQVSAAVKNLSNVSLTGWLDRDEIRHLLQMSHVGLVACASVRDTVPNKPFEYLSAGLPILSSLEGEMADIIAEHRIGRTYTTGDAHGLLRLVTELATNEGLRREMSENSRRAFREHFDAVHTTSRYADHLEAVAAEHDRTMTRVPGPHIGA